MYYIHFLYFKYDNYNQIALTEYGSNNKQPSMLDSILLGVY